MKIKLLIIGIIAFIFCGCYTSTLNSDTYGQSDNYTYIEYNNFDCVDCDYEMYYCFTCQTFHIRVFHLCPYHRDWYNNWYITNHYRYKNNYMMHFNFRDKNRYFLKDHNILRDGRQKTHDGYVQPPVKRNRDIIKRTPPVRRTETIQRDNSRSNNGDRNKGRK